MLKRLRSRARLLLRGSEFRRALDEEMSYMLSYQHAYEAMIKVASALDEFRDHTLSDVTPQNGAHSFRETHGRDPSNTRIVAGKQVLE